MRFGNNSLFAFLFIFIHVLLFTDYNPNLKLKPLLRIIPGLFFIFNVGIEKKDISVILTLFLICLLNMNNINIFSIIYRATHFLITLSIARFIANELINSRTEIVLYPLYISIILSIISIFIDLGVDNFEKRIGYTDLIQFSGIFSNPITLGWACFFSLLFNRFKKKKESLIISLSIIIMGYYTFSRQFLLNLILYLSQLILRKKPKLSSFLLISLLISSPIWLLYLIQNKLIFVSDLDISVLGSRLEVINLFSKLREDIGILGLGYGNSENFIYNQIGRDYSFHSSYLNILAEFGLFGWLILILFIPCVVIIDLQQKENPYFLIQLLLLSFLTSVFDYSSSFVAPFFYILFFFTLNNKHSEKI